MPALRKLLLCLFVVTVVQFSSAVFESSNAAAEEQIEPQQVIQHISRQLLEIKHDELTRLNEDPAFVLDRVSSILSPYVDFSRVSTLILGKRWRQATNQQKQEFSLEFKRLLVRTYFTAIREFGDWEIRYKPLRKNEQGNKVQVDTQLLPYGGQPVDVSYYMQRKKGNWMAYDIKIKGVSLVTSYRSTFAKEIRKTGIDGLIKKIAALNDQREMKDHS